MTNFSRHYPLLPLLYTSLLCLVAVTQLSSCSILQNTLLQGQKSHSLELDQLLARNAAWSRVSHNPFLYVNNSYDSPVFLTSIRDCEGLDSSVLMTTRRLLIGFQKMRYLEQTYIDLGQLRVLKSRLTAQLDLNNILILLYSHKASACLTDYVLWTSANSSTEALTAAQSEIEALLSSANNSHFEGR